MPLFYQQHIDQNTRLGIWNIAEPEPFFDLNISLKKEITHPHKRLQHLAGRYLLPRLFPDFPNHEIEIADTRRPFLPAEQYHFSISHCGDYAAAIVSSTHRVGIDVETMNPKVYRIQHKFLHPEELAFILANPAETHLKMLSIAWNAKEAIYKWYGLGQVDFSNMMRLAPFALNTEGTIAARFIKPGFEQNMLVHYCLFDTLVLAWIV